LGFRLLGFQSVASVLLQVYNRHHGPFQATLGSLRFAVVKPIQSVSMTTTFLNERAIDYGYLATLGWSDLLASWSG